MSLFSKFDEVRAGIESLVKNGRNPFDVRFERVLSPTEALLTGVDSVSGQYAVGEACS